MTIEELKRESFFQQLSDGQQKYVLARCGGKDRLEAAKSAWTCATDDSAKAQAARAEKNANVAWLLNRFLGVGAATRTPSREELIYEFWQRMQRTNCDNSDAAKFGQLIMDLSGFKIKPAENTSPRDAEPTVWDEVKALEEQASK